MSEIPETRDSLLVRVKNPADSAAWEQFAQIYRPVVYRLARGRGLQDADAQDLAQKVLISVAAAIPNWKRTSPNARFHHWLRRVAKNEVLKTLSRKPKDQASGGTTATKLLRGQINASCDIEDLIDLEYRRQLIRRAAEIVRERADETTWSAFSLTMVDGHSISEAAQRLGRNEGMVYAARSRVVRRMRDEIRKMEGERDE